jgi:hypothetical protein
MDSFGAQENDGDLTYEGQAILTVAWVRWLKTIYAQKLTRGSLAVLSNPYSGKI